MAADVLAPWVTMASAAKILTAVFKTNGRPVAWRPKFGLDQFNLTLGKQKL